MKEYPHGNCECVAGCQCERNGPGPAYAEVTRDGKRMKVCSRCTLFGDKDEKLLVTAEDSASVYLDYDPLLFFALENLQ
tara:strand:+ start:254 stop:490 length:237 start_codon:yes stop_codon:yes gene_type:complete